jgi:hypothetical protein
MGTALLLLYNKCVACALDMTIVYKVSGTLYSQSLITCTQCKSHTSNSIKLINDFIPVYGYNRHENDQIDATKLLTEEVVVKL